MATFLPITCESEATRGEERGCKGSGAWESGRHAIDRAAGAEKLARIEEFEAFRGENARGRAGLRCEIAPPCAPYPPCAGSRPP